MSEALAVIDQTEFPFKRIYIRIEGRVQGVGFRYATYRKANSLGIFGHVRNEHDGAVLIEAEGTEDQLDDLLKWARQGPAVARVERILHEYGEILGEQEFTIIK